MERKATAVWRGDVRSGRGSLSTESSSLHEAQYSFGTRFENGVGTNPEELQAACAAASSSSGLVPTPFSNRVPNEYCASCRELLSVDNDPLPLLTSPRQTAVAFRSISRPFQSDQAFDGI